MVIDVLTRAAGWALALVFSAVGAAGAPAVGLVGVGMTVVAVAVKSIVREVPH